MRKTCVTLIAILVYIFAQSQAIVKGDKFFGLQTNLLTADLYYTYFDLSFNKNESRIGFHLAPTWQWAIDNNFVLGTAAHIGFNSEKTKNNYSFASTENKYEGFDLGANAFSRYYIDVLRNKKLKIFGLVGVHLAYSASRSSNNLSTNSQTYSETLVRGSFGFGAAYAGKKGMIEMNISNGGLFLGVHKRLKGRSGK